MPLTLPDELVANRVLPTLRAMLARELRAADWSQDRIADALGVSQAAVSKYLSGRMTLETLITEDADARATTARLAGRANDGSVDGPGLMAEVHALVRRMENRGPVCTMHEAAMPALVGLGCDLCVNPDSRIADEATVLSELRLALRRLPDVPGLGAWVPHVGSNLALAVEGAADVADVAAVPGRIDGAGGRVRVPAAPAWGASRHVAQVVLAAHAERPELRAAANVAYRRTLVEAAQALGWRVAGFDAAYDGRGERLALAFGGEAPPDLLYHEGAFGIEPVAYVLGRDASDVVDRLEVLVAAAGPPGPLDEP